MGVDVPFFCGGGGGNDGADPKDECYTLWKREFIHVNSMKTPKNTFGANLIMNGSMVLVGGRDKTKQKQELNGFEMVSLTDTEELTPLPDEVGEPCIVQALETSFMAIGGWNGEYSSSTFIFDMIEKKWSSGPSLINGRTVAACARIEIGQVYYIVVAGGESIGYVETDLVEILDLSKMDAWVQGPSMPKGSSWLSSVTNDKGTGMIISGGQTQAGVLDDIYELDCSHSIEDCKWTKLEQKLKYARAGHISMLIPDDLAQELCLNP